MLHTLKGLVFATFCFLLLNAFGAKHSKVETKVNASAQQLEIEVIVKPDPGMMLTQEGPWQLTLSNTQGLKLETKDGKFVSKDFQESIPGFKVQAPLEANAQAGKLDYTVKAFVCTVDKKQCFPQQHKGSIEWKRS